MSPSARSRLFYLLVIVALVIGAWWFGKNDPSSGAGDDVTIGATQDASGDQWSVQYVIDGDTIVVSRDGVEETVRFIGIDTPERGECGYGEAKEELAGMIDGRTVTLVPGAETDRDDYGRLPRYVEVGGVDIGLRLIETGYAAEVFDFRTGQPHDREDDYLDVDDASPDLCPGWG
jgi:micrococcal nuclease